MKLNRAVKLAFRNLGKTKSKTILSCVGVAIGSVLLLLIVFACMGVQKYGQEEILSHFKSLELITVLPFQTEIGMGMDTSDDTGAKFKQSDVDKIKAAVGADSKVYPDIMLSASSADLSKTIAVSGGSDEYYAQEFIQQDKLAIVGSKELKENEISLSSTAAEQLEAKVGDQIDLVFSFPKITSEYTYAEDLPSADYVGGKQLNVKVANIYQVNDDVENALLENFISTATSVKILKDSYNDIAERYYEILIVAPSFQKVDEASQKIDDLGYYSYNLNKVIDGFNTTYQTANYIGAAIGIIALLISMFGIANTMVMSVMERTREIGLFKALGMTNGAIKIIFVCEGGLIGFFGGVIGIIISVVISLLGNYFFIKFGGESGFAIFNIQLWLLAAVLLFTVVVSILASLIPASRAAKIDPIKALRSY